MPHEFFVGQTVRCINQRGVVGQFTFGNTYVLTQVNGTSLSMLDDEGRPNGWSSRNFEPVPDNRQTIVLYTVILRNQRGGIYSHGYTTEQQANEKKAELERAAGRNRFEIVGMKKITVRI